MRISVLLVLLVGLSIYSKAQTDSWPSLESDTLVLLVRSGQQSGPFIDDCSKKYALVFTGTIVQLGDIQAWDEIVSHRSGIIKINEILYSDRRYEYYKKENYCFVDKIHLMIQFKTIGTKVIVFAYSKNRSIFIPQTHYGESSSILVLQDFNEAIVASMRKYIRADQDPLALSDDIEIWAKFSNYYGFGQNLTRRIECVKKKENPLLSDYILEYSDYETNEIQIITLSQKEIDKLQKDLPLMLIDSCMKYDPDMLYNKCLKNYENQMSLNGFASEAGQDQFYQITSMIMRKEVDQQMKDADSLRHQLKLVLETVNSTFRCVSQGGTMYFHMSERIYAHVEWYIIHGIETNFNIEWIWTEDEIHERFREVIKSYDINLSNEDLENCIYPFSDKKSVQSNWVSGRGYDFIKKYE